MRWRVSVWVLALVALLMPSPSRLVEAAFSNGVFPWTQRALTTMSNLAPFALFDVLLVGVVAGVLTLTVRDFRTRHGALRVAGRLSSRLLTVAAVAYLAFLFVWGLNYRRMPLTARLEFDSSRVTPAAARALAETTVARLNTLFDSAHAEADAIDRGVDTNLRRAYSEALPLLGVRHRFVPGRQKVTLLDGYFRRAGVAGMTDPYFLESLIASDLLPVERPAVVAHEWSHLAGIADEGEANFAGWLICLHGSPLHQYSAWLALYDDVSSGLPADVRREVASRLADGPRADLAAIRERLLSNISPMLSGAGWRVYDHYLKANRVDSGTASYAEIVRLVLGTRFDDEWRPRLR